MWKPGRADETVHVRVMGALAVGKTTLVSTAVTRTSQKRPMPYSRSRHNQRFVCSTKSPSGELVVAELIDTKGNETLENVISEGASGNSLPEERRNLLDKDDSIITWCYLIVFDFTRQDTYIYAKRLIEKIRNQELAQAYTRLRKGPHSPIFLVGNKREMCAPATLTAWIQDIIKFSRSREGFCYTFSGSAMDNSFSWLDASNVPEEFRLDQAPENPRLTVEQLIYLFKVKLEAMRGDNHRRSSLEDISSARKDTQSSDVEDDDSDTDEVSSNACAGCCARCCSWGRRPSPNAKQG